VPALFILMIVMGGYCAFYYGDAHLHALVKGGLAVAAVVAAVRWVASRAIEHVRVGRHRRRIERLQAFSNQLVRGRIDGVGFYSGGETTVSGVLEGRVVELRVFADRKVFLSYDVRLEGQPRGLDAVRPGLLSRLAGRGPVFRSLEGSRSRELDDALRRVLVTHGLARVTIAGRTLRAEKRLAERDLERTVDTFRELLRLGRIREHGGTRRFQRV